MADFSPGFCFHRCAVAGFLRGLTRRLRREWWDCRPERAVLSFDAKESTKESRQHGDSRGGPRRYALRPSPALRLGLATRFMAFSHFWH